MENKICAICGKQYATGGVLLHNRLSKILDKETVTGYGFCETCQDYTDKGYIVLVEVDNAPVDGKMHLKVSEATRTGNIAFLKKDVCDKVFNIEIKTPFVYIDKLVFTQLSSIKGATNLSPN